MIWYKILLGWKRVPHSCLTTWVVLGFPLTCRSSIVKSCKRKWNLSAWMSTLSPTTSISSQSPVKRNGPCKTLDFIKQVFCRLCTLSSFWTFRVLEASTQRLKALGDCSDKHSTDLANSTERQQSLLTLPSTLMRIKHQTSLCSLRQ